MKGDMFGKPLAAGDLVACLPSYAKRITLAQVIKSTPKRVQVHVVSEDGTLSHWPRQCRDAVFLVAAADVTDDIRKLLATKVKINE